MPAPIITDSAELLAESADGPGAQEIAGSRSHDKLIDAPARHEARFAPSFCCENCWPLGDWTETEGVVEVRIGIATLGRISTR